MRLLFDQNISPKILKRLPDKFSDCQQVRFLGLEDVADAEIFHYAKANGYTVVTFDSDFVDLNSIWGTPPKIIYLNTGNLTTRSISELLLNHWLYIQRYLEADTDDILEIIGEE